MQQFLNGIFFRDNFMLEVSFLLENTFWFFLIEKCVQSSLNKQFCKKNNQIKNHFVLELNF